MKCQICHKNEAQIVFTQIVDNEKIVMQICTECAKEKGLSIEFETVESAPKSPSVVFDDITLELKEKEKEEIPDLACEVCGLTFAEFKRTGLFGCDSCHAAFGDHVKTILKEIHGVSVHNVEEPVDLSKKGELRKRLKKLRAELKHCVEMEEYERAAELRDKIAELQRGMSDQ